MVTPALLKADLPCLVCGFRLQERDRDAAAAKAKEVLRWDVDSKRYADKNDRKRTFAVIVAQAIIRRFLVRCVWARHKKAKGRVVAACQIQKHWRRMVAKRLLEAMKRVKKNKDMDR